MTNNKQSLTDYYDAKGKIRFMMVTSKEYKADLSRICKAHGISQGALLEVFLDLYPGFDKLAFDMVAKSKQKAKKADRGITVSDVAKKIKGLPKEQLEAIEKFIEEQKAKAEDDAGRAEHGVFS